MCDILNYMNFKVWAGIAVALIVGFVAGTYFPQLPAILARNTPPPSSNDTTPVTSVFGTVTATSPSSITLKLLDGTTQTIAVSSSTVVYAPPPPAELGSVTVGANVAATFVPDVATPFAQSITIVPVATVPGQ